MKTAIEMRTEHVANAVNRFVEMRGYDLEKFPCLDAQFGAVCLAVHMTLAAAGDHSDFYETYGETLSMLRRAYGGLL